MMVTNAFCIFELALLGIVFVLFKTSLNKKAQVYLHYNVRLGNIQMKIKCNLYNDLVALNARIKKFIICLKIVTRLKLSQSLQNRFASTYIL